MEQIQQFTNEQCRCRGIRVDVIALRIARIRAVMIHLCCVVGTLQQHLTGTQSCAIRSIHGNGQIVMGGSLIRCQVIVCPCHKGQVVRYFVLAEDIHLLAQLLKSQSKCQGAADGVPVRVHVGTQGNGFRRQYHLSNRLRVTLQFRVLPFHVRQSLPTSVHPPAPWQCARHRQCSGR